MKQTKLTGSRQFTPVSYAEGSYAMTPADFDDGFHVRWSVDGGTMIATGENKLGILVTAPLNVPLCNGCDEPIVDHLCANCELIFTGDPQ